MDLDKLIVLKTLSLIHDPPWKPLVIIGKKVAHPKREEIKSLLGSEADKLDSHELDAIALAKQIGVLPSTYMEHLEVIHRIDYVSSGFDRLLLYKINPKIKSDAVMLLNIFDPNICLFQEENKENECDYLRVIGNEVVVTVKNAANLFGDKLSGVLRDIDDEILRYHVLWYLIEPLWLDVCRDSGGYSRPYCVMPSDTRVPTHSVFDHVYATAMVSNIYDGKRFDGYIVLVDYASVQEYISSSRKIRDLWVSSWISSLLSWLTIEPLVACFGPDIVVKPSLRGNWFYTAWLITKLREKGHNTKDLERIAEKAYGFEGCPLQPVMPTHVTLLLPRIENLDPIRCSEISSMVDKDWYERLFLALRSGDTNKLRELLVEVGKKAWIRIVNEILKDELLEGLIRATIKPMGNKVDERNIIKIKEFIREVASEPPLPLRLIVYRINRIYEKYYRKWLKNKFKHGDRDKDNKIYYDVEKRKLVFSMDGKSYKIDEETLFYHYMMKEFLPSREALYKLTRIDPLAYRLPEAWSKYADPLGKVFKHLKYCTVCGKYAGIAGSTSENWEKFLKQLAKDSLLEKISGLFGEGERLCPKCLLKRLLTIKENYEKVLEITGLKPKHTECPDIWVPTTNDLANLDNILSILGVGGRLKDSIENVFYKLSKMSSEERTGFIVKLVTLSKTLSELHRFDISVLPLREFKEISIRVNEVCRDIEEKLQGCSEKLISSIEKIIGSIIEALTEDDYREKFIKELDKMRKYNKDIVSWIEEILDKLPRLTKYVIIRGDGDSLGSCLLSGNLGYSGEEYINKIINKVTKSIDKDVLNDEFEIWKKLLKILSEKLGTTIPVTPSYHYSVSRALSLGAIRDYAIVKKHHGFLVYTGGDDILVLSPTYLFLKEPVIPYLEILRETRLNYWGYNVFKFYEGFHVGPTPYIDLKEYIPIVSPAIRIFGRSYGIVLAHYRDPLSIVLRKSGSVEESSKKSVSGPIECIIDKQKQSNRCGKDLIIKDHLTIHDMRSYVHATVPLRLWSNDIVAIHDKIKKFLGLLNEGKISVSLLYDIYSYSYEKIIKKLVEKKQFGYAEKILFKIFKQNTSIHDEDILKKYFNELFREGNKSLLMMVTVGLDEEIKECCVEKTVYQINTDHFRSVVLNLIDLVKIISKGR